jgi:lipopolysaccharide export system permease protein
VQTVWISVLSLFAIVKVAIVSSTYSRRFSTYFFNVIIYRYLSSQVLVATLAVGFVLSLIVISGRFLGYMAEAANGEIEGWAVMLVLFYRLPEFMVLILPLSLFLGVLLAYGRMYVEYEMIVLKACGMGQWRLVALSMIPAVCMAVLVAYLSLVLTPKGYLNSNKILVQQYTRSALELLTPGHFFTTNKGTVVYAESLNTDKTELRGFFSSTKNENEFITIMAESGRRVLDDQTGEQYMELKKGFRYEISKGTQSLSETAFDSYRYKLKGPDTNRERDKIQSTSTLDLFSAKDRLEQAELQWRLSLAPLSIIIVLLAVPLSKVNPRQGRFLKLLPAILIYLAYVGSVLVLKNSIGDGKIGVYPGVWLSHMAFLLLAVLLLQWESIRSSFSRIKGRRKAHKVNQ